MKMFRLVRKLQFAACMLFLLAEFPAHSSDDTSSVQMTVASVEKIGKAAYRVHIMVTNSGKLPIFLPTRGLGKPNAIFSLRVEKLSPSKGWVPLPVNLEHMHVYDQAITIEPHQSFEDHFELDDPYINPLFIPGKRNARAIPLTGKLRLSVGYFSGEAAWQEYVDQVKALEDLPPAQRIANAKKKKTSNRSGKRPLSNCVVQA